MKTNSVTTKRGSVLMVTILTISIMTLLCATSLYIASQNANAGMQTASWQASLTGAESGVDAAIRALNTGTWTNWVSVSTALPAPPPGSEPSPSATPAPAGAPDSTHYNLLPSSALGLSMQGEGGVTVSSWVTVDTAGMLPGQDTNGQQWYRIRATGQSNTSGSARVSASKLDDNLRNTIALRFNRKGGNKLGPSRTIEVIMQPLATSGWGRGLLLKNAITMSGGSYIDSFDSTDAFKSTNGLYDQSKRQSHGDIATLASGNSNLGSMYVYGNLSYSGSAVKNTSHVQGTISTPFSATVPATADPGATWTPFANQTLNSTQTVTVSGTQGAPTRIKTGDLNLSGSNILTVAPQTPGTPAYVEIWVTGQLNISGSAQIVQQQGVNVKIYVDKAITLSGGSVSNGNGTAASLSIIGTGNGTGSSQNATFSGSSGFIGTVNAPSYDFNISGSANYAGAFIGNTMNLSGGAAIHYDESLNTAGTSPTVGNYAFASWFEDNSDPTHKDQNGNYITY